MTAPTITVEKDQSWDHHGWTATPNALIRDVTLTPDAKWAFAWLASHNTTFLFSADDLAKAGPKGRNHARAALRELEMHGWMTREKRTDPSTGRIVGTIYKLHPVPVPEQARTFVASKAKAVPAAERRRSGPGPRFPVAGPQADPGNSETGRSDPATEIPGAGVQGAGPRGTGDPVAPSKDEKTTSEDHPPTPGARPDGRATGSEEEGSAPASGAPAPRTSDDPPRQARCEHNRTQCRACGTSPRARAAAAQAAVAASGESCTMCVRTPSGGWQRIDPSTRDPLPIVRGIVHTRTCDHTTPHEQVQAAIDAADRAPVA